MNRRRLVAGLVRMWRNEIAYLQPTGLFNLGYLRRSLPPEQALHRALWWRNRNRLPRLLWLALQVLRILHWRWLGYRRAVAAAVLAFSERIARDEGIPVAEQRDRIAVWARQWCIMPDEAYAFGLYRKGRDGLLRLYPDEQLSFHRVLNANRGACKADYRTVQDKQYLADRLSELGIPVAATLNAKQGGFEQLESALAAMPAVFCKLRYGSRGESAFRVESSADGLIGLTLAGKLLDTEAGVLAAWSELAGKGPVLIQPYLHNHPLLQGLSPEADSITLRVITRMQGNAASVWTGLLYVQAPGDAVDRGYWLLKIDADSGQVVDAFGLWPTSEGGVDNPAQLRMLDGQAMPYWPDIARFSAQAHAELPRLWAVAWDWIVTPEGPVLLEGNSGWDIMPLQELGVDFVKIGCDMIGKPHQ